ncbi:MAG: DNA polymerase III subunit gamma/tau [Lachnospiraceae bacterium]|nr:DNA polymerase III subunit gamma/tau [Lachnospiraceae bacterium]
MSYVALYRKFRPASFAEVKGQDHIVKALKNQIESDRVGHAYLFSGTRGTGKTSIAKIFAKTVNCENPVDGQPCNKCKSCQAVNEQNSMNVIEIDAASNNGVENIRQIIEEVAYSPTSGRYKVYIIDEVHMLSAGAFNALLKTLEEPPSYVIFILATTEAHKIPVTILSRCQRYDFKRLSVESIVERINELIEVEGIKAEKKALTYIARLADGAMRDALSLLDQCIAFYLGEELTYERVLEVLGAVDTDIYIDMLSHIINGEISSAVKIIDDVIVQGRDLSQFVANYTWFLRNAMIIKSSLKRDELVDMPKDKIETISDMIVSLDIESIFRYIRVMSELINQLRYSTSKRTLVEMTVIKLCVPSMETVEDALYDRIGAIERKLEKGFVASGAVEDNAPSSKDVGESGSSQGRDNERSYSPEQIEEYAKALDEDIVKVAKNWQAIVNQIQQPARLYLQKAKPCAGENATLVVVFYDSMGYDFISRELHKNQLVNSISSIIKKQIEVRIVDGNEDKGADRGPDISKIFKGVSTSAKNLTEFVE